jgi:Ran-binding protein 3
VVPPKKPQSTFGAFSSSASPFASTSSASPFASTSKPLSTGSAFGNYSSTSSPFARKPPAFASADAAAAPVDKEEKKETESTTEKTEVKSGNSFGDILKESKADEGDDNEKVQMTEKDGMSSFFSVVA